MRRRSVLVRLGAFVCLNISTWAISGQIAAKEPLPKIAQRVLWTPADAAATAATFPRLGSALENAEPIRQLLLEQIGRDIPGVELRWRATQQSLLDTHFSFDQVVGEQVVFQAEASASISDSDGSVAKIFYRIDPEASAIEVRAPVLSAEAALVAAWGALGASGTLTQEPQSAMGYARHAGKLRLVYRVVIATSSPAGEWQQDVDAVSGRVFRKKDMRLPRHGVLKPNRAAGIAKSWREALREYRSAHPALLSMATSFADGQAKVFDPDPRTTLRTNAIQDNSPADDFLPAYRERTLRDLRRDGATYSLVGPWVQIVDFEAPATRPSTTTDGNWDFMRGQKAFTDAMTYFHIDQSQRYMQSLGFVGNRAIQGGSIRIDADALNGADNSYFSPSSNVLAFGHGCVDDNEDADVILHEYGHAINYSINRNWGGGDSGAMGEGFGDYWAGSYSFSAEEGDFENNWVFNWDGHGEGRPCWGGRVLNGLNLRYEHNRTYPAHSPIPGGQSDELWSTPLFQSRKALLELGHGRDEVDRVILEAQFGLGSGLKMRQMATAIVSAATRLYPEGAHARVFTDSFERHGILERRRPAGR